MSLTNFLLLLILAIFTTYTFMPWSTIDKGSKRKIGAQFILWFLFFGVIIFLLQHFNFILEN